MKKLKRDEQISKILAERDELLNKAEELQKEAERLKLVPVCKTCGIDYKVLNKKGLCKKCASEDARRKKADIEIEREMILVVLEELDNKGASQNPRVKFVREGILPIEECVLRKRYLEQKTFAEISDGLSCTKQWIGYVDKRARRRIRARAAFFDKSQIQNSENEQMPISVRAHSCLARAGIKSLSDLVRFMEEGGNLRSIRNLGKKTEEEIVEFYNKNKWMVKLL